MSDAVRFVSAAVRHPARGVAALLPAMPGVPAELELPQALRVVDETDTAWLARGLAPSVRELAGGLLLAIALDVEAAAEDDAEPGLPYVRMPVVVSVLARDVDAHRVLEVARHVQRAVLRAVLAAFPGPRAVAGSLHLDRPTPADVARARAFVPVGDSIVALEQVFALRALDPWAWGLS